MAGITTYSFLDVQAAITGPGGAFSIGAGSGNAEEGITIAPTEDVDTMTIGADGTPMHSLHASKGGRVVVRLQKTSPTNALLSQMLALQRSSGALHGQNTITITNTATGDNITCQLCAFGKQPEIKYGKEGGFNEWEFLCGIVDQQLGGGVLLT
jgi:Protein of unknown function (DUF3277)